MSDPYQWYTLFEKLPEDGDIIRIETKMSKHQVQVCGMMCRAWAYELGEEVCKVGDIVRWRECHGMDF